MGSHGGASWGLVGAGALGLAWALGGQATFFPDGYELAAAGACFWGMAEHPSLPCAALDLGYTTPLFPLLTGPLGALLGLWRGAQVLALLALALCWLPLQRLALGLGGLPGALAVLVLLAMSPELGAWARVPDERPLALLLSASAWTAAALARDRRGALWAGGLAGLGVWARPEALALVVLVPGALLLARRRGLVPWAALSAGLLAGGWLLIQRGVGGTWLPRPYEVAALQLLPDLPDVWAKRLVGMGAWSPPLRAWALAAEQAAPAGSLSPDPVAATRWTLRALAVGSSPALWLAAGLGAATALSSPLRLRRHLLLAAVGLCLPWLAASTLLHARLDALPLANLLAVLLSLSLLAGTGIAEVCRRLLPPPLRAGGAVLLAVGLGSLWPPSPVRPGVELTAPGLAAAQWLQDHPGTVISSYESAPIAFRAAQPWREWPSPFEPTRWQGADYLLQSHLDLPEPMALGLPPPSPEALLVGWTWQGEWVRLYRLSPPPTDSE